jgi:hypothetical protein
MAARWAGGMRRLGMMCVRGPPLNAGKEPASLGQVRVMVWRRRLSMLVQAVGLPELPDLYP